MAPGLALHLIRGYHLQAGLQKTRRIPGAGLDRGGCRFELVPGGSGIDRDAPNGE